MTSTRIAAAAIGLVVVLPLLLFLGVAGAVFIVGVAMAICLGEYAEMAFPGDFRYAFYWLCLSSYSLAVSMLWGPPELLPVVAGVLLMLTMAQITLAPPEPITAAADRLSRYVLGVAWIGGLFPFLVELRMLDGGLAWVLLVLMISWCGDTGAYFAGRAFGKHPLHPVVSPKKTWEGFVGGLVGSVIGVVIMKVAWLDGLDAIDCVVLGVFGSAVGVVGDLAESLLKRSFGVKDSGWIMPGHGGLLDRVDSVLFVAPTVYAWVTMVRGA